MRGGSGVKRYSQRAPSETIVQGTVVLRQRRLDTVHEALAQRDHALEGSVGEHLAERGARGREREGVAGERAAHAARVLVVGVRLIRDPLGQLGS